MRSTFENPENKENKNTQNIYRRITLKKRIPEIRQSLHLDDQTSQPKYKSLCNSIKTNIIKQNDIIYVQVNVTTTSKGIKYIPKINIVDVNQMYLFKETAYAMSVYGNDSLKAIIQYEKESLIPDDFLLKTKVSKEIHIKMIDWMVEVLAVYMSSDDTFFLSVKIMDLFLYKSNQIIKDEDIHLIGMVSMFIANKMCDVRQISLQSFTEKIAHGQFTINDIVEKEREIIETIDFEKLICGNLGEVIHLLILDFIENNKLVIQQHNLYELLKEFEQISIFIAKIIVHFDIFHAYGESIKAVGCLMVGLSVLKDKSTRLTHNQFNCIFHWVQMNMVRIGNNINIMHEVYKQVVNYYSLYPGIGFLNKNVIKFYKMTFK
jgi:hypothetical protein